MLARGRVLAAVLALAAFFACVFVMWSDEKRAHGLVEEGVFYVWPRLGGAEIGPEAADILREQSDVVVAAERAGLIMVSSGIGQAYTQAAFADESYSKAVRLTMLDGGFFTVLRSHGQFVILSETLAWKLFGDFHAAGKTVLVGQAEYKVLGVARQQNPVDYAWLPLAALEGAADQNAGSLYVMPKPYNKINGYRTCEELLGLAGINRFDYRITDLNEYIGSIARRPVFTLSLFCALAAGFLLFFGWRKRKPVKTTLATIAAALLVSRLNFTMWVPGFGSGGWFATFTNAGLLPADDFLAPHLLELSRLNSAANAWFLAGLAALIVLGTLAVVGFHKLR